MIRQGFETELVLGLGILEFQSLHASCQRLEAAEKTEDAWTSMIAAQGKVEDMKKHVKRWSESLGRLGAKAAHSAKEFCAAFGKGI